MLVDQRNSIKPKTATKKKRVSKVPKEPWDNKFTNNARQEALIQKEKIERRKLYDMQLKKKLNEDPRNRYSMV